RAVRVLLLVLGAGALAVVVIVWLRVAAFNDAVSTASAYSTALLGPLNGDGRVNVLMLGYGGPEQNGGQSLSDSINILSIDPASDTTTLIAVPRDLWVEGVGEMPGNGKVNQAFAIGYGEGGVEGGASLSAEVLSEVTGLDVEHWMAIDFAGFHEMVDAVGGVTIDNPTAFAYTTYEPAHEAGIWNGGEFPAGRLHLDGDEALAYARARYTSVPEESSDFARSIRQQRIMAALQSKLGSGGFSSIGPGLAVMSALEGRLTTDLSAIDLFLLSGHLDVDRRLTLPEDEVLRATVNTAGEYILIPVDWSGPGQYGLVHQYLAERLAEPDDAGAEAGSG
ncbi:MAG TPA: LCP family protein, partial [Candidatus Limnocylindria bacterium]|nr:LCP family protein [Candidatus Limnocylindria bacterium]